MQDWTFMSLGVFREEHVFSFLLIGGWASTSNIYFLSHFNLRSCLKVTLIFGKK